MEAAQLQKYAELLVKAGGNVQPGQVVVIGSDVEDAQFARWVQNYAYDAGAAEVVMNWADAASTRTRYLRAADNRQYGAIVRCRAGNLPPVC